jgi:hypothetical protein
MSSIIGALKSSAILRGGMVKAKKRTSPTQASGFRSRGKKKESIKVNVETGIEDVVYPPTAEQMAIPSEIKNKVQQKLNFIERTITLREQEKYNERVRFLSAFQRSMQRANVELERVSPELFKKAMLKDEGTYFPLDRRFLLDTPPLLRWNHDNIVNCSVSELKTSQNK